MTGPSCTAGIVGVLRFDEARDHGDDAVDIALPAYAGFLQKLDEAGKRFLGEPVGFT
jgi:hypothetical protein